MNRAVQRCRIAVPVVCTQIGVRFAIWRWAPLAMMSGALATALSAQAPVRLPVANASTDFVFNRLLGAAELPDGSLIVTDRVDDKVYRVRFDDSAPRELLRHGSGPGEFRNVGRVFPVSGDSVLVVDAFTGRWIILRGDLAVGTIPEGRPLNTAVRGNIFGVSRGGKVLGVNGRAWAAGDGPRSPSTADTLAVLLGDIGAASSNEVARLAGPGRRGYAVLKASGRGPGRMTTQNPLAVADQTLLLADGWIAVARNTPYRVDWRSPTGVWQQGAILEGPARRVTRDDQCRAIAEFSGTTAQCQPEEYPGWPHLLPSFVIPRRAIPAPGMLDDASGRVLIARTPDGASSARRYDLIDRKLGRVKVIAINENQRVLAFGKNAIYLTEIDDDGAQRITRHAWP